MKHLVFIDDHQKELDDMRDVVALMFRYQGIKWPENSRSIESTVPEPPDIFVLDLYLPPKDGPDRANIPAQQVPEQRECSQRIAECFQKLYPDPLPPEFNAKALLQSTMECLTKGRQLLDMQWKALDQNPMHGLDLLQWLRTRKKFRAVPVVFYSRKITPEDVIRVLKAGAADALRKPSRKEMADGAKKQILERFERAIEFNRSQKADAIRRLGLNANYTLLTD